LDAGTLLDAGTALEAGVPDEGAWVCGGVDVVGADAGDDDVLCVGVGVGVGVDVGLGVVVGVGVDVGVGLCDVGGAVVGDACVAGVDAAGADVGCCAGVLEGLAVAVWPAGALVAFPARDAVGLTPVLGLLPVECEVSRTATTAMMATATAAAAMGQRHRRNGD